MIAMVLGGEHDPSALKDASDDLFNDDARRPQISIRDELHVDLLALHGGKEVVQGSKEMAVKFNLRSVRETPVDFNAPSTTHQEKVDLFAVYNLMDLDTILAACAVSEREVEMRIALMLEFGTNVISQPDAGVADHIMRSLLYPGAKLPYPTTDTWRLPLGPLCRKVIFHGVQGSPEHQELLDLQQRLSQVVLDFKVVETVESGRKKKKLDGTRLSETVKLRDKSGTVAKGGFHTDDQPSFWIADDRRRLLECDFNSFYPALILFHKLCPQHIPAHPFLHSLKKLVDKRLAVRDTDPVLSAGMKVAVNSVFGKTGSPYSWLCDPTALFSVTILGQLTILALIDLLFVCEDHVELVSANTDAVLFRVTREAADIVIEACNDWAATQGQSLGWTEFSRVVKRDVNNYLGFGLDGKVIRAKGAYAYDAYRVRGKACNRVVIDAVQAYFRDDTPIEQTIRAETRVEQFIDYRKTSRTHVLVASNGDIIGSIARWVIVSSDTDDTHRIDAMRRSDGQRTQVVERGALLLPDLPDALPPNLDYQRYIDMAQALIDAIIDPPTRETHTVPLAELSKAQRDLHLANANTLTADLAKCGEIEMAKLREDYAAVYKGNQRDTMKACLLRLWWREAGNLTHGDLLHLAQELDAGAGYFAGSKARNLEKMCEWIAHDLSPFPLPRTSEEYASRALVWAAEHVEPLKRKRTKVHRNAVTSDFINGTVLRHYGKTKNEYKLACHISSVSVKHAVGLSVADVVAIISDVKTYFEPEDIDETVR